MPASPLSGQRHFRLQDDFLPEMGMYQLLPFRFIPLDAKQYVLTNFVGEYCVVERESLQALVAKTLRPGNTAFSTSSYSTYLAPKFVLGILVLFTIRRIIC